MSALNLVEVMLVIIGSAIAVVLLTVWVSSLIRAHRIRLESSLGDVRSLIIAALSGADVDARPALTGLSWFARRYIVDTLLDLAPSVSGSSRTILVELGEIIGLLASAERGVRSRRWAKRLYSARVLTAFGIDSDLICGLMADRAPEVRAQAATWSTATPNEKGIDALITLLGDPDGLCRFAARDGLIRVGRQASTPLIAALETADVGATVQILEIASAMGDDRFYSAAHDRTSAISAPIRAAAAAVLARTGNSGAGPRLAEMLEDPSEDVVLAAAQGLGKLGYWPAAAAVEPLLGSPSWRVRKQAGLSLLALGAPGTILLWANAPGDGEEAEMAIQTLQLRASSTQTEAA
jgi:HEAT repeat protein